MTTTCPTCERLEREIAWWKRVDYRTWRDKAEELLRHKMAEHVPTVKQSRTF